MQPSDDPRHDPLEEFEQAMRRWADRPPRTLPGEAVQQIRQQLGEAEPKKKFWMHWPVAALVLLTLAAALLWRSAPDPPAPASNQTQLASVPSLDENTLLIWLDAETPLYLALNPPASAAQGEKP